MDFRQLEMVRAIVDCGSMSEAARYLFCSQPSLSAQIQRLEQELGLSLFDRSKRPLELTPAGQFVYRAASDMLTLQERLYHELSSQYSQEIRVGASTVPSAFLLPDFLASFHECHPDSHYYVQRGDSLEIIRLVAEGLLDCGLVGTQTDEPHLQYTELCSDQLVLALPATEHYRALIAHADLKRLLQEPLILREEGSGTLRESRRYLEQMGLSTEDINVVARMNDPEAIRQAIVAGLGTSLLSNFVVQDLSESGQLLTVELPERGHRPFYLVTRDSYDEKPLLRIFMSELKASAGQLSSLAYAAAQG